MFSCSCRLEFESPALDSTLPRVARILDESEVLGSTLDLLEGYRSRTDALLSLLGWKPHIRRWYAGCGRRLVDRIGRARCRSLDREMSALLRYFLDTTARRR